MKNIDRALDAVTMSAVDTQPLIIKLMKMRNENGLSQNQLANKIKVSHTTIARIENFTMQPTLKMMLQILDVFGMTLSVTPQKERIATEEIKIATEEEDSEILEFNQAPSVGAEHIQKIFSCLLDLPLCTDVEANYSQYISQLLSSYCDAMQKNNISSKTIAKVSRFSKYVNIILDEFGCGQHNLAYEFFKQALQSCMDTDAFLREVPDQKVFYRGRKNGGKVYTPEEMFHIPFEKRYMVSTQRYSFPGVPCLYLGASPEICYTELGETKSKVSIAKVSYKSHGKSYRVFDLTKPFSDYFAGLFETSMENFLGTIPLILACSTSIDYAKTTPPKFREEYVFPQLLLEYVMNETILNDSTVIGLGYFSSKENFIEYFLEGNYRQLHDISNYVFPAKCSKEHVGLSEELMDIFEVIDINN